MRSAPAVSDVSLRLERTCALGEAASRLHYVSGARAQALDRLGIATCLDLLERIPHRYLDFSHALSVEQAPIGQVATVVVTVDRIVEKRPRPRMHITEVSALDATGVIVATFFKQPWIAQQLAPGDRVALHGKVEFNYGFKRMQAPLYEKIDERSATGSIVPVHSVTEGISVAWWRRIVAAALERVSEVCDPLPARLRARRGLMSRGRALRSIHFPRQMADVRLARRRLSYEEVLLLQLALRLRNDVDLLGVHAVAHTPARHKRFPPHKRRDGWLFQQRRPLLCRPD